MDTSKTSTAEAIQLPDVVPSIPKAGQVYRDLVQAAEQVLGRSDFIEVFQVSRRGGVALLHHTGGLKVFKYIGCQADWKKRWARRIGWHAGRRAFDMSALLSAAGVPVCPVEAYGSVKLPTAPRAIWTLSQFAGNGITLRELKQELQGEVRSPQDPQIQAFFEEALRLMRKMHEAGFEHRDFHAGNILVQERSKLLLFDLETVARRRATIARRARDIRRFLENFVQPDDYLQVIERALQLYAPGEDKLQRQIRNTWRMRGLIRKKGERRMGTVGGW